MTMTICPAAPQETPLVSAPPIVPQEEGAVVLGGPAEVAAWLRSLAPDDVCGYSHISDRCPLANYLNVRHATTRRLANVMATVYYLSDRWGPPRVLPYWAQLFVQEIDRLPTIMKQRWSVGITARDALEVLDRVCCYQGMSLKED